MENKIIAIDKELQEKSAEKFLDVIENLPKVPTRLLIKTEINGVTFEPGWYGVRVNTVADQFMIGTEILFESKEQCIKACIIYNKFLGYSNEQISRLFSLWDAPILNNSFFENIKHEHIFI